MRERERTGALKMNKVTSGNILGKQRVVWMERKQEMEKEIKCRER